MKCPGCELENPPETPRCLCCGHEFSIHGEAPARVNDRFPVLSFIATFLGVVGWLIAAVGIAVAALGLGKMLQVDAVGWWDFAPLFAGLLIVALGALVVAVGESIGVLFAIEANTRATAIRLPRLP